MNCGWNLVRNFMSSDQLMHQMWLGKYFPPHTAARQMSQHSLIHLEKLKVSNQTKILWRAVATFSCPTQLSERDESRNGPAMESGFSDCWRLKRTRLDSSIALVCKKKKLFQLQFNSLHNWGFPGWRISSLILKKSSVWNEEPVNQSVLFEII